MSLFRTIFPKKNLNDRDVEHFKAAVALLIETPKIFGGCRDREHEIFGDYFLYGYVARMVSHLLSLYGLTSSPSYAETNLELLQYALYKMFGKIEIEYYREFSQKAMTDPLGELGCRIADKEFALICLEKKTKTPWAVVEYLKTKYPSKE